MRVPSLFNYGLSIDSCPHSLLYEAISAGVDFPFLLPLLFLQIMRRTFLVPFPVRSVVVSRYSFFCEATTCTFRFFLPLFLSSRRLQFFGSTLRRGKRKPLCCLVLLACRFSRVVFFFFSFFRDLKRTFFSLFSVKPYPLAGFLPPSQVACDDRWFFVNPPPPLSQSFYT